MRHEPFDRQIKRRPFPNHSSDHRLKVEVGNVDVWYGEKHALTDVSLDECEVR